MIRKSISPSLLTDSNAILDSKSGYDSITGVYHSKYPSINLPANPFLDIVTHIFYVNRSIRKALVDASTGRSLTYADLHGHVRAAAAGLSQIGIGHGDVVMILAPNSMEYVLTMFAIMLAGAVVTTVNPIYTVAEVANQVKDSNPKLIVTIQELVEKVVSFQLPLLLLGADQTSPTISTALPTFFISHLLASDPSKVATNQIRQSDTAALLYSSGTTGLSKGVAISHRNLIATTLQVGGQAPDGNETYLFAVPPYHIYGFSPLTCGMLRKGHTLVIMPQFDFEQMLVTIQRYRVTMLPAVPPIVNSIIKSPIVSKYDLTSLKHVGSGGAPLSKEVSEAFVERYPCVTLGQGYGLTETCATGTMPDLEDTHHMGSVGLLSANLKAKVVDVENGKCMPPNAKGELWLHGPSIASGYLNNQAATSSSFDIEGWFHTGDLVYFDEDGYLYVIDRIKELIKYKAFQVAPAELEAILLQHSEIKDVAIIGYPDKDAGEIPMAFIVRSEKSALSEDMIKAYVAHQVAPYKKIRRVAFINEIPRSSTGKILRRELANLSTARL
ncbi:hypothetical protein O6H91_15G001800 [Diphasiastrum complanatum]|uniref:Uncharacterized protein n=3 Tax=Diphasiastrum complanatum TaxID=34168 RepID=A0ACC2BF55_DIPCM|nr:hypothetical protein O6H91_15G001400 [Diphasiastrum complanatum]KAJ7528385.1 hypothetical protein O6H91_15G001400 [Diphasiastrum complanatum]KAJ7528389.1 hypothetical protein O6H91_15G001800 [Diphasiastrum complanatum]